MALGNLELDIGCCLACYVIGYMHLGSMICLWGDTVQLKNNEYKRPYDSSTLK